MYVKIRKKTLILFSILAGLTVAGLCAGILILDRTRKNETARYEASIAADWRLSVAELSQSLSELETDLQKGLYASGDYQTVSWAAQVFAEAGAARTALEALPVYDLQLRGTETFLNQVGEFTLEMARKQMRGETLTEQEEQALKTLALRSRELADEVLTLSERVSDENPGYEALQELLLPSEEGEEKNAFEALEDIFSEDDPLTYDGDHSAWYETRTADWLNGQSAVTEEKAKAKAAEILGVKTEEITVNGRFDTPFSYYECSAGDKIAAVTEQGGMIYGFARQREVPDALLSLEAVLYHGQSNLAQLGYTGMEPILWSTSEHTVTAVYVLKQDGVLVYSDRITVTLALDNGEILTLNALEYLMCHDPDRVADITVSQEDAKAILREGLTAEDAKLVSTSGGDGTETLCWQLTVHDGTETRALVFVNANTKVEEDILILVEGEGFRRMV